ncbi:MAG: transcriptional regulator [Candidatus Bathyarchaeia archaeon]
MDRDQFVGVLLLLVCVVVAVGYLVGLFLFPSIQFWLIAAPVVIAFMVVLSIGAWIGWTMATTPSPEPIEEIEGEKKIEEAKQGEQQTQS